MINLWRNYRRALRVRRPLDLVHLAVGLPHTNSNPGGLVWGNQQATGQEGSHFTPLPADAKQSPNFGVPLDL